MDGVRRHFGSSRKINCQLTIKYWKKTMRYPKKFYYTDRQNSIVYRRQPTPSLKFDINRMLKGLPCWIDDSSTSKEKNKKLIVFKVKRRN